MVNSGSLNGKVLEWSGFWLRGGGDRATGPFCFLNQTPNPESEDMKLIALSLALAFAALTLGACGHKKQQTAYPTAPAPIVYAK